MPGIPLFDIEALGGPDAEAGRRISLAIGAACREVGFFAITGHGVAAPRLADALAAAHELFDLPGPDKQALAIGVHGHNRGYVAPGVEALDERTAPDRKEAFNLIWTDEHERPPNVWPPLPGWRPRMQAYFDAVLAVGRRLHRAFEIDLGLPAGFFDDKLDRPMATLRLLRYPAPGPADPLPGQPGAGVHTDYGNVTLLATDGVAGLQVQRRDGGWIDVPPLPGAFVCNIGDCLMRWTNDVYVSTPHRVLPPARQRHSIAFFLDPNPDAWVAALPGCVPAGQAPRHPPIRAEDHLRQRFAATYGR